MTCPRQVPRLRTAAPDSMRDRPGAATGGDRCSTSCSAAGRDARRVVDRVLDRAGRVLGDGRLRGAVVTGGVLGRGLLGARGVLARRVLASGVLRRGVLGARRVLAGGVLAGGVLGRRLLAARSVLAGRVLRRRVLGGGILGGHVPHGVVDGARRVLHDARPVVGGAVVGVARVVGDPVVGRVVGHAGLVDRVLDGAGRVLDETRAVVDRCGHRVVDRRGAGPVVDRRGSLLARALLGRHRALLRAGRGRRGLRRLGLGRLLLGRRLGRGRDAAGLAVGVALLAHDRRGALVVLLVRLLGGLLGGLLLVRRLVAHCHRAARRLPGAVD